jgi:hypothetical protein
MPCFVLPSLESRRSTIFVLQDRYPALYLHQTAFLTRDELRSVGGHLKDQASRIIFVRSLVITSLIDFLAGGERNNLWAQIPAVSAEEL